ncbi:ribonucleoside diphosphate reductase beta subunit [Escherichia phage H8]|nr:ribonucleoside diphosphate reductase beta subunit [Escherichia phage H8]
MTTLLNLNWDHTNADLFLGRFSRYRRLCTCSTSRTRTSGTSATLSILD